MLISAISAERDSIHRTKGYCFAVFKLIFFVVLRLPLSSCCIEFAFKIHQVSSWVRRIKLKILIRHYKRNPKMLLILHFIEVVTSPWNRGCNIFSLQVISACINVSSYVCQCVPVCACVFVCLCRWVALLPPALRSHYQWLCSLWFWTTQSHFSCFFSVRLRVSLAYQSFCSLELCTKRYSQLLRSFEQHIEQKLSIT